MGIIAFVGIAIGTHNPNLIPPFLNKSFIAKQIGDYSDIMAMSHVYIWTGRWYEMNI